MGRRKRNSSAKAAASTKEPEKSEKGKKVEQNQPEQMHKPQQNGVAQNGQVKGKNKTGNKNAQIHVRTASPDHKLRQLPQSLGIFYTLFYFILEVFCIIRDLIKSILCLRRLIPTLLLVSAVLSFYLVPGSHRNYVKGIEKQVFWCLYWVGLGVLSSVGLGTGLHTFLIYLGPHIARVTLAAFECNSLDFPEPPYPDDVVCPNSLEAPLISSITLWQIISKVRVESLMWGAGTALGELPPYFMAKAARISGQKPDDEDYEEFLAIVEGDIPKELTIMDKLKLWMEKVVARVGFFGILLFASIPNPFFDLAGITCGHFLIPFWTFFGATLIGKALVKMHVQMLFVVLAFSEHHVERLVNLLKNVPYVGGYIRAPLKEFLQAQKIRLHRRPGDPIPEQATSLLQHVMSVVVAGMIIWFVISLINSLAQRYHKRRLKQQQQSLKLKAN